MLLPEPSWVRWARYVAVSLRWASGTSSETIRTSNPGAPAESCFTEPKVTPTMITPCTSAAMNTVVVRRSRVGAMPSRNCSARALISARFRAYAAR
jgi:hypothetical protein